ncbi:hypothetical protein CPC16_009383 [Podila verticillata]|uniref:Uncharacterized protein n=1 Tax=Podila verticillata NRRL 6337 TaxID=1069443 RepID=A0A086TK86_9FUNG|nr:hypothetical protein CPC16_009383 [Podila verticillata]KFH62363.1 hypothetical protein MVEG_11573 [Podila verticillata NRRL 6337]
MSRHTNKGKGVSRVDSIELEDSGSDTFVDDDMSETDAATTSTTNTGITTRYSTWESMIGADPTTNNNTDYGHSGSSSGTASASYDFGMENEDEGEEEDEKEDEKEDEEDQHSSPSYRFIRSPAPEPDHDEDEDDDDEDEEGLLDCHLCNSDPTQSMHTH